MRHRRALLRDKRILQERNSLTQHEYYDELHEDDPNFKVHSTNKKSF
jgi:hypothetical protein